MDYQIDPTAADAMSKLAWVTIFIMAMLSILQTLGVSVTSLLAFGGAAGIAVGFAARGVHGQTIYIDPKAEMVLVRFASHPIAANGANDPTSLPAYQAVAEYLLQKP